MSERAKIYKVVLLGDGAVGKTSLRKRFLGQGYSKSYSMTIGADFGVKRIGIKRKSYVIQIWDIAGQDRFSSIRDMYLKNADGALVLFDISRPLSFENIPNWVKDLSESNNNNSIPLVLIGNKEDLRKEDSIFISKEQAEEYAESLTDWGNYDIEYIETSAKTGANVEEAFKSLILKIDKLKNKKNI